MAKINKAIVAAFTAGSTVFVASAVLNNVLEQAAAAVAAAIVAGVLVYFVPNAPPAPPQVG